jgi:hypothetical protein
MLNFIAQKKIVPKLLCQIIIWMPITVKSELNRKCEKMFPTLHWRFSHPAPVELLLRSNPLIPPPLVVARQLICRMQAAEVRLMMLLDFHHCCTPVFVRHFFPACPHPPHPTSSPKAPGGIGRCTG